MTNSIKIYKRNFSETYIWYYMIQDSECYRIDGAIFYGSVEDIIKACYNYTNANKEPCQFRFTDGEFCIVAESSSIEELCLMFPEYLI